MLFLRLFSFKFLNHLRRSLLRAFPSHKIRLFLFRHPKVLFPKFCVLSALKLKYIKRFTLAHSILFIQRQTIAILHSDFKLSLFANILKSSLRTHFLAADQFSKFIPTLTRCESLFLRIRDQMYKLLEISYPLLFPNFFITIFFVFFHQF